MERILWSINRIHVGWLYPLFSWILWLGRRWHYKEKFDADHDWSDEQTGNADGAAKSRKSGQCIRKALSTRVVVREETRLTGTFINKFRSEQRCADSSRLWQAMCTWHTMRKESARKSTRHEDHLDRSMSKSFEKRCPPGLWCGKKRATLDTQSSGANANEDQPDKSEIDTFRKRCPPGLWCGRKREMFKNALSGATDTETDQEHSSIEAFEKRCPPPGLWCGKKRGILGKAVDNTMTKGFEKRCPPGLWCGKKRSLSKQESKWSPNLESEMNDVELLSGKFQKRCPPGLWCGKKRGIQVDAPVAWWVLSCII